MNNKKVTRAASPLSKETTPEQHRLDEQPAPAAIAAGLRLLQALLSLTEALVDGDKGAGTPGAGLDLTKAQQLLQKRQAIMDKMAETDSLQLLATWPAAEKEAARAYVTKLHRLEESMLQNWQQRLVDHQKEMAQLRSNRQRLQRHRRARPTGPSVYLDSEI